MDWNALTGALIGAGIPASLVYAGLHRQRQSADAEAFGPAVLLLDRVNPDRLTINLIPDPVAEAAMLADLQQQISLARERLLVVSAGNPRRQVRKLARIAEVKLANVFHGSSWAVRDLQAEQSRMDGACTQDACRGRGRDGRPDRSELRLERVRSQAASDARRSDRQRWPAPPVVAPSRRCRVDERPRRRGRLT